MRSATAILLGALLLACGQGDRRGFYDARGVVRDVHAEYGQLVVEHEDIPGLMPAMTMNFDVAAPEILESVERGDVIEFLLQFTGKGYRILSVRVVGGAESRGDAPALAAAVARRDPAPAFALTDQGGRPLALADLRGKAVVLDFIFTSCPGPCPILTGLMVDLQKRLAPEVRERTRFVSITLDPARDTPLELRAYARKRGADLSDWSFLTGPPDEVAEIVASYGVGSVRRPDGNIDHLVVTFLIDGEGRIAERYIGLDHGPEEIERDLVRILS